MTTLTATTRADISREALATEGRIPAVIYGNKINSTPIAISGVDFDKIWKSAGETSTITLELDGKNHTVLIHEVQYNPTKNIPTHVDFLAVDANKKVTVAVPVEFEGVAGAVKSNLGTLVKALHEVEIEALPKDLPHTLVVNIEKLAALHDEVLASDIVLPAGVTLVTEGSEVVAVINAFVEEKEETVVADLSSIEVEKKGKKEEEAEAVE